MSAPAGVVDGLLAGRYRLTFRLAAGGVGEVWRARDLLLDRDVAVKTLRPEIADDDEARERFRSEARLTGQLSHPGIAAVYDAGEDGARAWLVLELVEGESLRSLLRRSGRLSPERTLDVVAQAAAALHAAHERGIVHRDVTPGNLLVRTDGTVKVTDFGIAAVAGSARLTRTGQMVGTAAYLSPEQAAGGAATALSDLYALGIVAYECLTGAVPYPYDEPVAVLLAHTRTPPSPLPAEVPPLVRELVDALLAKDPSERPVSAREVVRRAEAAAAALTRTGAGARIGPPVPAAPSPAPSASSLVPAEVCEAPAASPSRPDVTAVLPAPGTRPPLLVRPAPASRRPPRAGLAGRPGQRGALRVTALLLGLLVVALGWHESSGQGPGPAPGPSPAPRSSAPPSSPGTEPSSGGEAPAGQAPVAGGPAARGGAGVDPALSRVQAPQAPQRGVPGAAARAVDRPVKATGKQRKAPGKADSTAGSTAGKAGSTAGKAGSTAGKAGRAADGSVDTAGDVADQRRPGGASGTRDGSGGGKGTGG